MISNTCVNICIASDNNYAPLVATTIASICFNTKRHIKFYCLESGISDFNKRLIDSMHKRFDNFDIKYITIDKQLINNFANQISTAGHISADTYSRLFIPELFKDMDKMIYLDVDLIATGDIGEMYDFDMSQYTFGAVSAEYGTDKSIWFQNMEMNPEHHYFNAGVLLMNPKKLYKDNFLSKISDIANKYSDIITLGDQDLLNKYCEMNYLELPWRFNLTTRFIEMELNNIDETHRTRMTKEHANCVIRHFESNTKPWNANKNVCNGGDIKNMSDFWTIAAMTPYLAWFERQFQIADGNRIKSAFNAKLNDKSAKMPADKILLFDILPILRIRHHGRKHYYMLMGILPIVSYKVKRNGTKRSWRLFDLIPILSLKQ